MPASVQNAISVPVRTGCPPSNTLTALGIKGESAGMQGMGVNTPKAAAVAAATMGFDGILHMANPGTLAKGTIDMIVAAGKGIIVIDVGNGKIGDIGLTPPEQLSIPPMDTVGPGIHYPFFFLV